VAEFSLTSSAVADGGTIPRPYTCDGEDRSPPLLWSAPPAGTRSLVLMLDDPDAPGGRFIHWLAWGIPPDTSGLGEGEPAPLEGRNGFGSVGYRGPCPPRGHGPHHYRFRLHAVAEELRLASGVGVRELEQALGPRTLRLRSSLVPTNADPVRVATRNLGRGRKIDEQPLDVIARQRVRLLYGGAAVTGVTVVGSPSRTPGTARLSYP